MYNWVDPSWSEAAQCTHSQRPEETRYCSVPPCDAKVFWVAGEWSQVLIKEVYTY